MKRITSAFTIALFTFCFSFAQSNFPFPTVYGEWVVFEKRAFIGAEDTYTVFRNIMQGDTVFKGKVYQKIYAQNLCQCLICTAPANYESTPDQTPWLQGGVREENGVVYYTGFGGTGDVYFNPVIDTMLFDFTLEVNDSFPYAETSFKVVSTDTTADGRRVINLVNQEIPYPMQWVEGIGCDRGLFGFSLFSWLSHEDFCFSDDPNNSCTIPCGITSINDPSDQTLIKIYPNSVTDRLTIEWSGGQAANLTVFSADGKLIREVRQMSSGNQVDVTSWSNGIYIIHLQFPDGKRVVRKVVKQV